jgi:hypothetical protein
LKRLRMQYHSHVQWNVINHNPIFCHGQKITGGFKGGGCAP